MDKTFRSKSAKILEAAKEKEGLQLQLLKQQQIQPVSASSTREVLIDKRLYVPNPVIWIGSDPDKFFTQGELFGFNCLWLKDLDLSVLTKAKCLIVSHMDLNKKAVAAVNFACEYGVPAIWLHKHLPPETHFWNFGLRLYTTGPKFFWEEVCQLIA